MLHRWRVRRGRRRGLKTTIVPYTGYGSTEWVRVLCRVVLARGVSEPSQRAAKVRGWRSFFSIPIVDEPITVTAGGVTQTLTADRDGIIDLRLEVALEPGWQELTLSAAGTEPVTAPVLVVDPAARFGVVSDIDDTVMVTALPRPFLAAWNTFVLDEHARRPVAGMAVLYERLHLRHPEAPFIYLSTGAWNVAPTLTRFLGRNLYPPGPLLLTDWGPTAEGWFRSGRQHKRSNLIRLASEFPAIRWLLVGDDGQHDPALYSEFAEQHPDNVSAVAIRQLTPGEAVLAGGRSQSGPHAGAPWIFASDGAGIAAQLAAIGLLP
jgi:phosphatidate phosphatase APP1